MFLDGTYFRGDLYLPGLNFRKGTVGVAKAVQVTTAGTLEWFINKYEIEFLNKLLGKKMYEDFIEGVKTASPQWMGLYQMIYREDGGMSISPAANYVYYHIRRHGRTQTTINGEVKAEQDYTQVALDGEKLVRTWNEMCRYVHDIRHFIFKSPDLNSNFCGGRFTPINTFNI